MFDWFSKLKLVMILLIPAQQVESFSLTHVPFYPEILLEAKSSNCIVLAADKQLWVYSLKGALLTSFSDHIEPISSICVVSCLSIEVQTFLLLLLVLHSLWFFSFYISLQDSFRVVTASQDLSLRVLTWRNSIEHGVTLESQFHLLGGSHTMSRYCMMWHVCNRWFIRSNHACTNHFKEIISTNVSFYIFRGFSHVACDYSSIVASVQGIDYEDVLKAYSFTSWPPQPHGKCFICFFHVYDRC